MKRICEIMTILALTAVFPACMPEVETLPGSRYVKADTVHHLHVLYPVYGSIDFIVGQPPEPHDTNVVFCCAAAFTDSMAWASEHADVVGPYAVGGQYFQTVSSPTSTGCFVCCQKEWAFASDSVEQKLREFAGKGGSGFSQMSLVPNKIPAAHREVVFNLLGLRCYETADSTLKVRFLRHRYRALCAKEQSLCIVESISPCTFAEFQSNLEQCQFDHAIYLDVGLGWSYAWYRLDDGSVRYLHSMPYPRSSNWIVFRK